MPALLFALVLAATPARQPLKFDTGRDVALTSVAAALWATGALLTPTLVPSHCRWCDEPLNRFDAWGASHLVWSDRGTAGTLSGVIGMGLIPVGVVGVDLLLAHHAGALGEAPEDLLIVAEAVALSGVANEIAKTAAARARPYARGKLNTGPADNVSFYSGHTNFAFATVVAFGTLAELRGDPHRVWIWAVGLPLAAFVGYLRVAANQHYLSDVLVGALMGSAFGAAIPLLLHGRESTSLTLSAGPRAIVLSGTF